MNWNKLTYGLALLMVVLGVVVFMTGLHNIDNAWNLKYLTSRGVQFVDNNLILSGVSADTLYSLGIVLTVAGFILTCVAIIILFLYRTNKTEVN